MLLGLISSNGSHPDVSTSFKRLQAEKLAADSVLCELTPLKSIQDAAALKEYIVNLNTKTEVCVRWYICCLNLSSYLYRFYKKS